MKKSDVQQPVLSFTAEHPEMQMQQWRRCLQEILRIIRTFSAITTANIITTAKVTLAATMAVDTITKNRNIT